MITASQQIDRVANSLTRLAQSRVIPARDVKALVLRLDRVANTLDQGEARVAVPEHRRTPFDIREMGGEEERSKYRQRRGPAQVNIQKIAKALLKQGVSPEEVTVDYLKENFPISHRDAEENLDWIQSSLQKFSGLSKAGSRQIPSKKKVGSLR